MMNEEIGEYLFEWPRETPHHPTWRCLDEVPFRARELPEGLAEISIDSRWPSFFPSPMCLVTTIASGEAALERIVGASIVNRFPYIVAISVCRDNLSARHHARRKFMKQLEESGVAAIQFISPSNSLDAALRAILTTAEERTADRISLSGLATRPGWSHSAPVFEDSYLIYEGRLVAPRQDFEGRSILSAPWRDVGSHRVYFLEVRTIQLRQDIALGNAQICWRSLPRWTPRNPTLGFAGPATKPSPNHGYVKEYRPNYRFPAANTIGFEFDCCEAGMAVKVLPPDPTGQIEIDNDRARWPCFFPCSLGMITTLTPDGPPNLMPCGSTTVVSRHPFVIAVAICQYAINDRYASRFTLRALRENGRFSCGVAYDDPALVAAITYAGNVSFERDPDKVANSGLTIVDLVGAPILSALPIHFDCRVIGEEPLGTHSLLFGEVERIFVRQDLDAGNKLSWMPWPDVKPIRDQRTAPFSNSSTSTVREIRGSIRRL